MLEQGVAECRYIGSARLLGCTGRTTSCWDDISEAHTGTPARQLPAPEQQGAYIKHAPQLTCGVWHADSILLSLELLVLVFQESGAGVVSSPRSEASRCVRLR